MREAKEGALPPQPVSETAATVGNPLYGPSGVMLYRAMVQTALGGFVPIDVEAATGDEAALKALEQVPGGKVTNISPAPQK